ncbi:MAG: hypothetical protein VW684_12435 [Betaproteobacteria bacterium]
MVEDLFKALGLMFLSASSWAIPWNSMSLEQLRELEISTLSEKELKRYFKVEKKLISQCENENKKNQKRHLRAERDRLSEVRSLPEFRVYLNTKVVRGEFDASPRVVGGRLSFEFESEDVGNESLYSSYLYKHDVFLRSADGVRGVMDVLNGTSTELYFWLEHNSESWFLIDQAVLAGGQKKSVIRVKSNLKECGVKLCEYEEHFVIPLSSEELRRWFESGENLRFRLRGEITQKGFVTTIPYEIAYGYVVGAGDNLSIISPETISKERSKITKSLESAVFQPIDCRR